MSDKLDEKTAQLAVDEYQIVFTSAERVLERTQATEVAAIKANDRKKAELEELIGNRESDFDMDRIKLLAHEWEGTQQAVKEACSARVTARIEYESALMFRNAAQRALEDAKKKKN